MTDRHPMRRRVAERVRDLAQGEITSDQLYREIAGLDPGGDRELAEVLAILKAAPTGAWFFGVDLAQCRKNPGRRLGELVERFLREEGAAAGD